MGERVRAVLFDLDGVLVDSYECWFEVVNAAAERFGAPTISHERLADLFGQGPEEDARLLFPGREVAEIRAVYDETMPAHVGRITLGPESHAVLDDLGRSGIRRAVVTNTQASLARLLLESTGLAERLDTWAGVGGDLGEKPAPDILLAVLQVLGLACDQAVLVGDSHYDEEAARSLDMPFVFFDLRAGGSLREALARTLD